MATEELEKYLDKKYILKSGRNVYYKGQHYFNDQLTDKIAEKAIKDFPTYAGKFLNERERAVLEAKVAAAAQIKGAENIAVDEATEKRIQLLIDEKEFELAKAEVPNLKVKETQELYLSDIEKAEEADKVDPDQEVLDKVKALIEAGDIEGAKEAGSELKGKSKGKVTKMVKAAEKAKDDKPE